MAVVVALSLGTGPALAYSSQAGTSGAQFLKIGAGARAAAMAEAYSAIADDPYALYYNPAGITRMTQPALAAAHTTYFQDSNYEVGAFAYPLPAGRAADGSANVLGLSIYDLSIADIEQRAGDTSQPAGYFSSGDFSYNATFAHRFDRALSVGVTGKVISQTIGSYSSTAFAGDAGAQYTPSPDSARALTLSAVLKNLGTRTSFAGQSDPLPLGVIVGAGLPIFKNFVVDVDATKYRDTDLTVSAGGEFRHDFGNDMIGALRAGYSSVRRQQDGFNGVALGAGAQFHRFAFDFAWVPFGDLGNTFRYSLQVRFGSSSEK